MPHIGLIVTGDEALRDFQVFVTTLETYHPTATLYVATDSTTQIHTIKHKCTIHTKLSLDKYVGKRRPEMEALPGTIYDSLFKDYTYEKAAVLEWIFESVKDIGVWFMDADIVHCGPLPAIPTGKTLALSPHYIRPADEARYGHYNAGFLWLNDKELIRVWREAGHTSKFFEQMALETVASTAKEKLYEFPIQVNFGWWRMFQGVEPPHAIQAKFSLFRNDEGIGIRYGGARLQSIHTHSTDVSTGANGLFNAWIVGFARRFPQHKPLASWVRTVFKV